MKDAELKNILEAALLVAGQPLSVERLLAVFPEQERPERDQVRAVLKVLGEEYEQRGVELKQVASGFRIQVRQTLEPWVSRLWEERPSRYTRALLETLSLIAYRQPITRAEIENVRGVAVSTSIMKTLQERNWVRIVGHRDVPGRPGMYATTREFLDYFNLKSLNDLPSLLELQDLDSMTAELDLELPDEIPEDQALSEQDADIDNIPSEPTANDGDKESPATIH